MIYKFCDWSGSWRRSMFTLYQTLKTRGTNEIQWMRDLHGVLYSGKWILFHGLLDIALGPQENDGFNTKTRGSGNQKINCHWYLEISYCHGGDLYPNICCNPSTWPTFTAYMLEAPTITRLKFYFKQCYNIIQSPDETPFSNLGKASMHAQIQT